MRSAIALFVWTITILLAIILLWLVVLRIRDTWFEPLPYRDPEPPPTTTTP